MTAFLLAGAKAVLAFFGYLGIHYACAYTLPFSSAGYTVCANVTAVSVFCLLCLWQRKCPFAAAGARAMRVPHWLCAVGAGVGGCLLVRLMMLTVPFPESWTQHYTERVELVAQAPTWLMYLSTVVVAPLTEELVFRGLIYRSLKGGMPRVVAVLLSSAVFAALHGTIMWMLYTFLLGVLLCALYESIRSLWACVACHAAFNIVGQISFVGKIPDAATTAVFAVGGAIFVGSLWYMRKVVQD